MLWKIWKITAKKNKKMLIRNKLKIIPEVNGKSAVFFSIRNIRVPSRALVKSGNVNNTAFPLFFILSIGTQPCNT